MGLKLTVTFGAAIGLVVSCGIIALLWLGVSGVLEVGRTDLMYAIWPSSRMLIGGWHTTPLGILVTIFSIVTNCLLYAGVALILRRGIVLIMNLSSAR